MRRVFSTLPLQDVFWPLAPAEGTLGSLEWISGAIFLGADRPTFDRIRTDGPRGDAEAELQRTLVHETFHYVQVVTTGFLYQWVETLTQITRGAVGEVLGGRGVESFDDLSRLSAELPAVVAAGWRSMLHEVVDELDRPREHDLTIRDLMESHATYVELRMDYECNGVGLLELFQRHDVPLAYRRAFDYASERLGTHRAFQTFSLFAFLALCSSDPVLSFVLLVDRARSLTPENKGDLDIDIDAFVQRCCGYKYLGSPVSWRQVQPLDAYQRSLDALRAAQAEGQFNLWYFFHEPMETLKRWAAGPEDGWVLLPAMVFEPQLTGGWPMAIPGGDEESYRALVWRLCTAAFFRAIFDSLATLDLVGVEGRHAGDRSKALEAARRGQSVDALYNLGLVAKQGGQHLPAFAWWRQAAATGDSEAMRALSISFSQAGDVDRCDRILADAGTMMPAELRFLDAIHLATMHQLGASLARIMTYDDRMSAAATAMGRSVVAPS